MKRDHATKLIPTSSSKINHFAHGNGIQYAMECSSTPQDLAGEGNINFIISSSTMHNASRICAIPAQTGNGFRTAGSGSEQQARPGAATGEGEGAPRKTGRSLTLLLHDDDDDDSGSEGKQHNPGPNRKETKGETSIYTQSSRSTAMSATCFRLSA